MSLGGSPANAAGEGAATGQGATEAVLEVTRLMRPLREGAVSSQHFVMQRHNNKCVVAYSTTGAFLLCARRQTGLLKPNCWRIYAEQADVARPQGQLTTTSTADNTGYCGKLTWASSLGKTHYTLCATLPVPGTLPVQVTVKFKPTRWKIRLPQQAGCIFRSLPGASGGGTCTCLGCGVDPSQIIRIAQTGSPWDGDGNPTGSTKALKMAPSSVPSSSGRNAERVGACWDVRVVPPFSVFQAFGLALIRHTI